MPEIIELQDILRIQPSVDPDRLRESMELQEQLKNHGALRRGYELVPPFSGKRVEVMDTLSECRHTSGDNRD
jgi:hypothetical protein